MLEDYAGRTAFITGGASGIGLGIAEALADRGLSVALADIDGDRALAEAERLRGQGFKALGIALDVRSEQAWAHALDEVERVLGPLCVVCANAGVTGNVLPIAESSLEGWRFTLDINLDGCFLAARMAVPRLVAQGRPGHFIATSSGGAFIPFATNAAYSAAKAGVNAMCEALADELRDTQVKVCVLSPGLVKTRLHETSDKIAPSQIALGSHSREVIQATGTAISPREVGEITVKGMDQGLFWLFTSAGIRDLLESRQRKLLGDLSAIFPPA